MLKKITVMIAMSLSIVFWFIVFWFIVSGLSANVIQYSLPIRWQLVVLCICIFYGLSPLLLTWGGLSLAKLFNCESEGKGIIVFHCPTFPWLGGVISWMVFAHWLVIFTIPSAILGVIALLISILNTS